MKTFKALVATILICSAAMLTSCKKDDIQPSGQSTTPNLSTRGGLAFHVRNSSGGDVSGATIGISLNQSDLTTNTYIATRNSNSSGMADFGKLNADNYYYEIDVTINSVAYHGEGVVQVQAGVDLTQDLTVQ